jgi:hypothetical protein
MLLRVYTTMVIIYVRLGRSSHHRQGHSGSGRRRSAGRVGCRHSDGDASIAVVDDTVRPFAMVSKHMGDVSSQGKTNT